MFSKVQKLIKVSELRRNLSKYLSQSASGPVVVSAGRSAGTRVLLDSELYNRLIEAFEDAEDSTILEQLVAEDDGERADWEVIKRQHSL